MPQPNKYQSRTISPLHTFMNMQEEMDRVMDRMFKDFIMVENPKMQGTWNPAVDIYEDNEKFVLKAELPGMEQQDIQISLENNTISIKGDRKVEMPPKEGHYHKLERMSGNFFRSFNLPSNINNEKVSAHFKNGVLEIELPKVEEKQSKSITIQAE